MSTYVAGDPEAVRRVAAAVGWTAASAEDVQQRILAIGTDTGGQVWRGPAADRFRQQLGELEPAMTRFVVAHREARAHLDTYAAALDEARTEARRADDDAALATADRNRHGALAGQASAEAAGHDRDVVAFRAALLRSRTARLAALHDPAYLAQLDAYDQNIRHRLRAAETAGVDARRRQRSADAQREAAETRIRAARRRAEEARERRDGAARLLIRRLEDCAARPRPAEFLGRFVEGVVGVGDLLEKVGGLTGALLDHRHKRSPYTGAWKWLLGRARQGSPLHSFLRYKRSPVIGWLQKGIAPVRGHLELVRKATDHPAVSKLVKAKLLIELYQDAERIRDHAAAGNGWGVAGATLGAGGRALQQIPTPVGYLAGLGARQVGSAVEATGELDWTEPVTLDGLRKYGWDSFKDGLRVVGGNF